MRTKIDRKLATVEKFTSFHFEFTGRLVTFKRFWVFFFEFDRFLRENGQVWFCPLVTQIWREIYWPPKLTRSREIKYLLLIYKHQWNTKWAFPRKLHIFTHEDNMLSSHVKRSPSLWLHNESRLWKQADLVFHWCFYHKQNNTYSLVDMNFIFSCSTRYRVDHSKIKFISTRGHAISST